jgi:hypothetical protein
LDLRALEPGKITLFSIPKLPICEVRPSPTLRATGHTTSNNLLVARLGDESREDKSETKEVFQDSDKEFNKDIDGDEEAGDHIL